VPTSEGVWCLKWKELSCRYKRINHGERVNLPTLKTLGGHTKTDRKFLSKVV
jgi:hypothetical protein